MGFTNAPTNKNRQSTGNFGKESVELEAINPDQLRSLAQGAILHQLPEDQFDVLKAEESERQQITGLIGMLINRSTTTKTRISKNTTKAKPRPRNRGRRSARRRSGDLAEFHDCWRRLGKRRHPSEDRAHDRFDVSPPPVLIRQRQPKAHVRSLSRWCRAGTAMTLSEGPND